MCVDGTWSGFPASDCRYFKPRSSRQFAPGRATPPIKMIRVSAIESIRRFKNADSWGPLVVDCSPPSSI